jgi:hypothetical protein
VRLGERIDARFRAPSCDDTIMRIGPVVRRRRRKGAAPGRRRGRRAVVVNDIVVFVDCLGILTGDLLGEVSPLSLASLALRSGGVCITV